MAIYWYFGLATMPAVAGVDTNDDYGIVNAWPTGERPAPDP